VHTARPSWTVLMCGCGSDGVLPLAHLPLERSSSYILHERPIPLYLPYRTDNRPSVPFLADLATRRSRG